MMVVLETLGPDERAVFVLREVFGFDHDGSPPRSAKSQPRCGRWRTGPATHYVQSRRRVSSPSTPSSPNKITLRFLTAWRPPGTSTA